MNTIPSNAPISISSLSLPLLHEVMEKVGDFPLLARVCKLFEKINKDPDFVSKILHTYIPYLRQIDESKTFPSASEFQRWAYPTLSREMQVLQITPADLEFIRDDLTSYRKAEIGRAHV
jgi:hypothetical protein